MNGSFQPTLPLVYDGGRLHPEQSDESLQLLLCQAADPDGDLMAVRHRIAQLSPERRQAALHQRQTLLLGGAAS